MQNETVELSIVMPCLNEERSLADCLQKAFSFLADNKLKGEVIVVDNGSSDNSPLIAQQFNSILVTEHEKGYGSASRAGIEKAKGKYVIIGDADASYDFSDLMSFLELLRNGSVLSNEGHFRFLAIRITT